MPEGRIPLVQAVVYSATSPKSNASYLALGKAMEEVEKGRPSEVPNPLKDASQDREALGHGKGYLYPHDFPDHYVPQIYWPDPVQLFEPTSLGYEAEIKKRLETWRNQAKASSVKSSSKKETD